METKLLMAALLVVTVLQGVVVSDTVTVTLQNGLAGYNGCSDTYIDSKEQTMYNHNSSTLVVKNEKCAT